MSLAYRTGTVAVTNGTPTVTGTSTGWATQVLPGDLFTLDGTRWAEVLSVASNTSLTLATNWGGSTASGQAYAIVRCSPQWADPSAAAQKLSTFLDTLRLFPVVATGDKNKYLRANSTGTGYEFSTARERLTANRTYYVRTDGNDSNDGLTNIGAGAFLTIQKAINTVYGELDIGTFTVTIQVGSGTYIENLTFTAPAVGFGAVLLRGDTATPANVIIAPSSGNAVAGSRFATIDMAGFKMLGTINASACRITLANMEFGAPVSGAHHMIAATQGFITISGAYTISGGGQTHALAQRNGSINMQASTVTLTGTPNFSTAFVVAQEQARVTASSSTYSGAATGVRHAATLQGAIFTASGNANYFPGSVAGTVDAATYSVFT